MSSRGIVTRCSSVPSCSITKASPRRMITTSPSGSESKFPTALKPSHGMLPPQGEPDVPPKSKVHSSAPVDPS